MPTTISDFWKHQIFSQRVARFWLRIKIDKKCHYGCLFYPRKDNLQHYKWNFYFEKNLEIRIGLVSREQDKYSCILDFFLVNTYLFFSNLGSQYLEMKVSPARYTSSGNNTFKDQK